MASPSSSIRLDCPACGTVELPVDAASLVLDLSGQGSDQVLRYTCPVCRTERIDQVGERAMRLLMSVGIGLVGSPSTLPSTSDGPGTRASN